jgi:tetratricopeptide (TPR) repeat protein
MRVIPRVCGRHQESELRSPPEPDGDGSFLLTFNGAGSMKLPKVFILLAIVLTALATITDGQTQEPAPRKPTFTDEIISQADGLVKRGQVPEAITLILAAAQKAPNNADFNFWLGKSYYRQGKYQIAVERLMTIVERLEKGSQRYKDAVRMLGMSQYVLGHLTDAIPFLELIVQWSPESQETTYALGICYIQTRQPIKSRAVYARLFGVSTDSASAYLLNAQMLVRQRFEETAEAELNQALRLDAKLPQANFILGELAIYRAEIDKGIKFFEKEIELNPANGMAYYRLGESLTRQLQWDQAIAPLQKSIWLNPFFSGPYIVLGKVYFKMDDLGNAEAMLRRSTAIDPNNFGAHYLLAQVLQKAGRQEDAKAEFTAAEKLRGRDDKEP